MTRTSKLAFASMLLAMLAFAGVAAAADPLAIFRQPGRTQRPPRVQTPGFNLAGTYGGVLNDQLLIDGNSYPLRTRTKPYLVGRGPIEVREIPIGSRVYASIVGTEPTGVIWGLIVRPADEAGAANALPAARVHDPNAPR